MKRRSGKHRYQECDLHQFSLSLFKFKSIYYIEKTILQSILTDLQVAKTNRGRSVSQVLKYYRCQKNINNINI